MSSSISLCTIDFEPVGKRVQVAQGTTLMDAARQAGVALSSTCGGEGTCGRCRVVVREGSVSEPGDADVHFLSQLELFSGQRLACQTQAHSDVKVDIPRASLATTQRLQVTAASGEVQVDAAVRPYEVTVPPPTLEDPRSDLERVLAALESAHGIRRLRTVPAVIRTLTPLLRQHDWRVTMFVRGAEIVGCAAPGARPVGLAVDLGTTKIAGYLVDLVTGEELAAAGVANPQIGYGEDIISRLVYANRNPGGDRVLAQVVREALDDLVESLSRTTGVARHEIAEACIVGNTAMTHLLLQLPTDQMASSPFVAASGAAIEVAAREIGLHLAADARVYVPPCLAGFVGADHVAMIMASNLDRHDRIALGIDIGTNTEIALSKPGLPFVASLSCASGPAFEGAHIRHGMRAATGAIERVRLVDSTVEVETIGDAPAVGICGSGIVDIVAELRRGELINTRGRMQNGRPNVRDGPAGREFVLVSGDSSGTGEDIVVTQKDIDEIQLAKAAVQTGIEVLLEATQTKLEDVDEIVVAGAFGTFLNLESAVVIGLLPRLPRERFRQVGNAAGAGAKQALLSRRERRRATEVARQARYIELTVYPGFNRRFAQALTLPLPGTGG